MIGWYHSGPKLRASDQEINDLFKRYIARPVMVIVDVRQQAVGIPTDAYFAVEEIKDVRYSIISPQLFAYQKVRMARRPGKRFCTSRRRLRRRKPKKSV